MPQLDTLTYLTQYTWTIVCLLILFALFSNRILPGIQQQLAIRTNIKKKERREAPRVFILSRLLQQYKR